MRAIYRSDGSIKLCGDYPADISAAITQAQADNKELYRVNPNTKTVYALPTCAAKYQKTVDNVILEMSAAEKSAVDAADYFKALPYYYKKTVDGVMVEMTAAEKAAVSIQNLQTSIVNATQSRLDTFGLTRGYSSTDSISKYQNISDAEIAALPASDQPLVTKFRAECRYLAVKIAQTWAVLYLGLAEMQAGNWPTQGAGQTPTGFADVESALPALVWPV